MTIPAPTNTVVGGPITLTAASPVGSVVCTDTGTYTPAATAREWQVNGVALAGAADVAETIQILEPGTHPVRVRVTNGDGSANATAVNVVVTDGYVAPGYVTGEGSNQRIHPSKLPAEYRDPTIATPGIPDAQSIACARLYGSVLTAATQPKVVSDTGAVLLGS